MPEFNVTLLREKFVLQDAVSGEMSDRLPMVALSNRMAVSLTNEFDEAPEVFIVRAQNMHSCVRFAAQLAREAQEGGSILQRRVAFDWAYAWENIIKGYEEKWNPSRWIAVYNKGRVVFEAGVGPRQPFLDVIEQCDARNKGEYELSLEIAKDAFRRAGKMVNINYESNVALVVHVTDEEGKCGLILRGPNRTTTFNFIARHKGGRVVRPSQCLSAAAAFLEGIQITFLIGMNQYKLQQELIGPKTHEAKQGSEAGQKLGRLKGAIDQFEQLLDVTYRPERPDFSEMIDSATAFARQFLAKQIVRETDGVTPADKSKL